MISVLIKQYVLAFFPLKFAFYFLVWKISSLLLGHKDILFLTILLKVFVALMFTFKSLIHLKLIFVKEITRFGFHFSFIKLCEHNLKNNSPLSPILLMSPPSKVSFPVFMGLVLGSVSLPLSLLLFLCLSLSHHHTVLLTIA